MKLKFGILMLGAALFTASCGGNKETATNNDKQDGHDHDMAAEKATYIVDTEASNIVWEGGTSGVSVMSHTGNIAVQQGNLELNGDKITGGSFEVDMRSIEPTDKNYTAENTASDLVSHLSTGDFFLVEEYPTAKFEITSVEGQNVKGNFTLRGTTNQETVVIESLDVTENGVKAKGSLTFDRQKYGVAWVHFMKDVLLKDNIKLQIELVASK